VDARVHKPLWVDFSKLEFRSRENPSRILVEKHGSILERINDIAFVDALPNTSHNLINFSWFCGHRTDRLTLGSHFVPGHKQERRGPSIPYLLVGLLVVLVLKELLVSIAFGKLSSPTTSIRVCFFIEIQDL
jgi:hypothetical protein